MQVELRDGFKAMVDEGDWERLSLGNYAWYAKAQSDGRRYVRANVWCPSEKRHLGVRMHRLILAANPGEYVDHIDGDGLNNLRANLRIATNAENQQNTGPRAGTSRFKGVAWYSRHGKWRAAFNWQGKNHFVGYFASEVEAALAYNAAILPLAGEFARLNVIDVDLPAPPDAP